MHYDFEQSVGYWVALTTQSLRRALKRELQKIGITLRQWEVLAWTVVDGELSQAELAERLGIEAPTLAGIISRMERDGWLERRCCHEDRRRKRVRMTAKAEAVWQEMTECCKAVREMAVRGISPDELQLFKSVCERIRTNVENGEPAPQGTLDAVPADPCAEVVGLTRD